MKETSTISIRAICAQDPTDVTSRPHSNPEFLWSDVHWADALAQFALATGVTVTAYATDAHVFSGPHLASPLTSVFKTKGLWAPDGALTAFEKRIVDDCCKEDVSIIRKFAAALTVIALPCKTHTGETVAALVFGWVFDHFPDPIECRRLASTLGMEEAFLWTTARSQVPTSPQKLATCKGLLAALSTSIADNLIARNKEALLLGEKEQILVDLEKERERLSLVLDELKVSIKIRDDFLASVSHDLRNPLSTILTITQLLRKKTTDVDLLTILDRLDANVKKEARLVDDLLDVARIKAGKLRVLLSEVDLCEILDATLEGVRAFAEQKRVAILIARCDPITMQADALRLQQVFWNILSNAIKFTPEGGTVAIAIRREGNEAIVTVKDSGAGITSEFLPKIFEKFSQARDETSGGPAGLGLGLAIAHSIVEMHGGNIAAQSEGVGKGSTFTVHLPLNPSKGTE